MPGYKASFDFRAFGDTPPAISLIIAVFLIVLAVALTMAGASAVADPLWKFAVAFIIVAVVLQVLYLVMRGR